MNPCEFFNVDILVGSNTFYHSVIILSCFPLTKGTLILASSETECYAVILDITFLLPSVVSAGALVHMCNSCFDLVVLYLSCFWYLLYSGFRSVQAYKCCLKLATSSLQHLLVIFKAICLTT